MVFYPDQRSLQDCSMVFRRGGELVEDKQFNARYFLKKVPGAKGTLVHFHGNAGNACDRYFVLDGLKDIPLNIILVEYPGYGGDNGSFGEKELLEGADNLFASIEKKGPSGPFYLFGESLGTAVATYIASRKSIRALILQSPFPSLSEVGQYHYPMFPVDLLMSHRFPLKEWAKKVDCPVLMIHGEEDRIIPIHFGKEAATYFPKTPRFKKIAGRAHNDLANSRAFWEELLNFLRP